MIKTEKVSKLTKFDLVDWIKYIWKNEGSASKLLTMASVLEEIRHTIRESEYREVKAEIEERIIALDFIRKEINKIWE